MPTRIREAGIVVGDPSWEFHLAYLISVNKAFCVVVYIVSEYLSVYVIYRIKFMNCTRPVFTHIACVWLGKSII